MKKREDKRMVDLDFIYSKLPFLDIYIYIYSKINIFIFLMHGHSSRSTFDLHLVKGPMAL